MNERFGLRHLPFGPEVLQASMLYAWRSEALIPIEVRVVDFGLVARNSDAARLRRRIEEKSTFADLS